MHIDEQVILGLDIGIGSVGWALIREENVAEQTVYTLMAANPSGKQTALSLGVRCMDVPEDPKTKELLNVKRRTARGQRRVIKRRAQRMVQLRHLLAQELYPGVLDIESFHRPLGKGLQCNPWEARVAGLSRLLNDAEFAAALLHMGKHRGFQSNSKREGADKETGKVLKAIKNLKNRMQEGDASTIGALLAQEPQKRNRAGWDGKPNYSNTQRRDLLREETNELFTRQREMGNRKATPELEQRYLELAFHQRPLASTAHMVGKCAFIPQEPRAPRFSPTAEAFRLGQRLTILRLIDADSKQRKLRTKEAQQVMQLLGAKKGISYKALRKILRLPDDVVFAGLNTKNSKQDPEAADIATRSGACGPGSYALAQCLGVDGFMRLREQRTTEGTPCLDALVKIISDNDDLEFIRKSIKEMPFNEEEKCGLLNGLQKGDFAAFKGTMHLSVKAMEIILPHMLEQMDYAAGCEMSGWNHALTKVVDVNDVRNPVVRRILREVRKQVNAIIREFAVIPGRVHVELLRDVAKSVEERNKIDKGIKERTEERKSLRAELAEQFGTTVDSISSTELRRYELWKAQNGKCAYHLLWQDGVGPRVYTGDFYGGGIPVHALRDAEHLTQIDHILPQSRTSDDSFHNQCLCMTAANQQKGNRTPFEWQGKSNDQAWHEFSEWVKTMPFKGLKKRNFLMENLDTEKEERFHERNKHDASYASRLVLHLLKNEFERKWGVSFAKEDGSERKRFFARPGSITAFLRRHWGVQGLKYDEENRRIGDRHHALDALVLAACTESLLQQVTTFLQNKEYGLTTEELPEPLLRLPLPKEASIAPEHLPALPSLPFRLGATRALQQIRVSRAETAKSKGALHEETLHGVRIEPNEQGKEITMLYGRKAINALERDDLVNIKDAHRCPDVVAALEQWLSEGKPQDQLPRSAKGDVIRRVQLQLGPKTSGILLQRGSGQAQADNGHMVRVDVFIKEKKYYLVPVYTWQVARGELPNRAITNNKPEDEWPVMDASFTFLFSLSTNSYVIIERKGVVQEGYYRACHRGDGRITLSPANDREKKNKLHPATKTLDRLSKFRVDRMGRLHKVEREPRPPAQLGATELPEAS